MDLRNRLVHFRICDVYIPDPEKVLFELCGADVLQGKVLDVSGSGAQRDTFAVIEVEGLKDRVVVPVDRIIGLP
jgi:hypothetical protein